MIVTKRLLKWMPENLKRRNIHMGGKMAEDSNDVNRSAVC